MLSCQTLLIALVGICSGSKYFEEECDRIRRPIHLLSNDELSLYVEGLQKIRKNGKYQYMVDAHHEHQTAHRGPSFFFFHSFFVWEVETLSA